MTPSKKLLLKNIIAVTTGAIFGIFALINVLGLVLYFINMDSSVLRPVMLGVSLLCTGWSSFYWFTRVYRRKERLEYLKSQISESIRKKETRKHNLELYKRILNEIENTNDEWFMSTSYDCSYTYGDSMYTYNSDMTFTLYIKDSEYQPKGYYQLASNDVVYRTVGIQLKDNTEEYFNLHRLYEQKKPLLEQAFKPNE